MSEDFIFQQKIIPQKTGNAYYTFIDMLDPQSSIEFVDDKGNARVQESSSKVLAKKIERDDGTIKYSVKLDNSARLFNPGSIFTQDKYSKFLDTVCRRSNKYKDVSERVFNLYLKFLKTKNVAYINNAEREMM